VGVLGSLLRYLPRGDDGLGLLDGELGALDEVGEVGLEEGQRCGRLVVQARKRDRNVKLRRDGGQEPGQLIEASDPIGVVLMPGSPGREQLPGPPIATGTRGRANDVFYQGSTIWHSQLITDLQRPPP
jgi:hypothetical protein